jgi:hypothetical protein
MDQGIFTQFVLDWNVMKNWPPILWAVFVALLAFLGAYADVLLHLYKHLGIMKYYILWAIALASFFYYMGRHATDTHIHHYVLAMIVLSFTCYQNVFLTVVHAIFTGIMIEGASHYGYDPIWTYKKHSAIEQEQRRSQIRYENHELSRL